VIGHTYSAEEKVSQNGPSWRVFLVPLLLKKWEKAIGFSDVIYDQTSSLSKTLE